jgi:hypothetical protein
MFVKGDAFSGSTTRQDVWSDWNDALALLRSAVTVHAVWIGGSFTTAKLDPGDIDVTYIVNANEMRGIQGGDDLDIVGIFYTPGRVKSDLRLNVDNFFVRIGKVAGWTRRINRVKEVMHATPSVPRRFPCW